MINTRILGSSAGLRKSAALTAMALAVGGGMGTAHASSFTVSPVRLKIETPQRAQSLQITNNGTEDLEAQVRIMRWTQVDGEDRLAPTDDVVVSPAILRVAPGKPQTVRVVRLQEGPVSNEVSYRVLVDELPRKPSTNEPTGITVLVRYSIPLFVQAASTQPKGPARPANLDQVQAQVIPGADGQSVLRVKNGGSSHLRISHLSTSNNDGSQQSLTGGLLGYVLAGQEMRWPLNVSSPLPVDLTLKARLNDDREARAIPLAKAAR